MLCYVTTLVLLRWACNNYQCIHVGRNGSIGSIGSISSIGSIGGIGSIGSIVQ